MLARDLGATSSLAVANQLAIISHSFSANLDADDELALKCDQAQTWSDIAAHKRHVRVTRTLEKRSDEIAQLALVDYVSDPNQGQAHLDDIVEAIPELTPQKNELYPLPSRSPASRAVAWHAKGFDVF